MRFLICIYIVIHSGIAVFAKSDDGRRSQELKVEVTNPLQVARRDELIYIAEAELKKLAPDFSSKSFGVYQGTTELASQYNTSDPERIGLMFLIPVIEPKQKLVLTIRYSQQAQQHTVFPKRVQAELSHKVGGHFENREYIGGTFQNTNYLRVPPEHKDHSWFIRYEGPGWESDQVGYRFYLDQRNATDVFGKLTKDVVLQQVGLDGFDSYHHLQPWGMDVMKVGKSLGIGSIGTLVQGKAERVAVTDSVTCRIAENGNIYADIVTRYYGWKAGSRRGALVSNLSIHAGTRASRQHLRVTGFDAICTGIVKDTAATLLVDKGSAGAYGYIATWGKQSLNQDNLGLAVLFRATDALAVTSDEFSHIVNLKVTQGEVMYYFLAAWEKEKEGITTQKAFEQYLQQLAQRLAQPLQIKIKRA